MSEREVFHYWRWRILFTSMVAYALYYTVRGNMTFATPGLMENFHFSKTQLGLIFSVGSIVYGVGKFVNGFISDRSSAQMFMTLGLVGTALCSFFLAFQNSLLGIGSLWIVSMWFQSMGWPPCSRLMTHWFSKRELGFVWGIWNSSHQLGAVFISTLGPIIILAFGFSSIFTIPALLCLTLALPVFFGLRDTPESMDLPTVEVMCEEHSSVQKVIEDEEDLSIKEIFLKKIIPNKQLWIVCFANLFVYIVRIGFFNWVPTFVKEYRGLELTSAGYQFALFELAGLLGGIFAGRLSDKAFKGNRTLISAINLFLIALAIALFFLPPAFKVVDIFAFFLIGFLIYGPQMLVGVAATDFASKKAAGAASGLTGLFGYLGSAVSGVLVGHLADTYSWSMVLIFFQICCLLGTAIFLFSYFSEKNAKI